MNKIIVASGPVIVEKKKVLLDKHGDDLHWKFCGGQPKEGESLIETAKRRAKEEMGIDVEITDLKPFVQYVQKEGPDGVLDILLVHYNAKRVGEIQPRADIKEWKWVPLADLEKEDLGPNIIPALVHFWYLDK